MSEAKSASISENIVMGKMNMKRLQKDIVDIIKSPLTDNGIYYVHDEDNMLKGYACITGPDDSIYRYGCYCFEFKFPTNYPFSPPKVNYLTNDGVTRFHPNLYRNGKVCISILNTWKGEQWTSCQTIKSILLMLVTLLHNKPLLNEPGFRETSTDFKPYNEIITYKNIEIAILKNLENKMQNVGPCRIFFPIYKKIILENYEKIKNYIVELKNNKEEQHYKVRVYGMSAITNYQDLEDKFNIIIKTL